MNLIFKLKRLQKKISKKASGITCSLKDDCVVLDGEAEVYDTIVELGQLAARSGFYGVINNIKLKGYTPAPIRRAPIEDQKLEGLHVDVLVIGGGVIGASILRELSKYKLSALLVEKEEDLAMQASSRNDGCVHVGLDLHKKSKKLHYLLEARKDFPSLCKCLDIDYREDGQTIAFKDNFMKFGIPYLRMKAKINKIPGGLKVLSHKKMKELEPNIAPDIKWGVFLPGAGTVSPYEFTIALAESAVLNGAKVEFETIAESMDVIDGVIKSVKTNRGTIYPTCVVNAAGVFSDQVAEMAHDRFFTIHPRKGTDTIMDKAVFSKLSHTGITVYDLNSNMKKTHSKGGGVIPTIDKNSLVGPDAKEVIEREDFSTEKADVDAVFKRHAHTMESLKEGDAITYFAGLRAATYEEDFIVQKGKWTKNIVHAAGIQSPGLTAAPAIGADVSRMAAEICGKTELNPNFNPIRKGIVKARNLSFNERDALIKKDSRYGHIICRCEEISEGEIIAAIHSPIPPKTIDGIKRRVRAGMGRCQGGFCQPLVSVLLAQENGLSLLDVKKKGQGRILFRDTKEETK